MIFFLISFLTIHYDGKIKTKSENVENKTFLLG